MTLAKYLKQYDLTINQVCALTGRNRQTLYNWYNHDRDFFIFLLLGIFYVRENDVSFSDADFPF